MITDTDNRITKAHMNSLFRAGWPLPASFGKPRAPGVEEKTARDVYVDTMTDLVSQYRSNAKFGLLVKLAPLAKEDLKKALYLAGYTEER